MLRRTYEGKNGDEFVGVIRTSDRMSEKTKTLENARTFDGRLLNVRDSIYGLRLPVEPYLRSTCP